MHSALQPPTSLHQLNRNFSHPRQTERSIEPPAAGEVQVNVKATGLCGSDLHYYIQYV